LSNLSFNEIRNIIQNESFTKYYNKKDIPHQIIDTLKSWNKDFSFANPDETFRSTDVIRDPKMPCRQIMIILKSSHNIFITYKHGGIGFHHHILWAKFDGENLVDLWIGVTFKEINDLEKVKLLLSGDPENLNTNIICY